MENQRLLSFLLSNAYDKLHIGQVCSSDLDFMKIYPMNFSSLSDETRIKILTEALKKKILITDTEEYQKYVEGVHHDIKFLS